MANTHYAIISFSGDPDGEHPDPELCGQSPHLHLIGAGPERFCWDALAAWTVKHPLRPWETAEVVARDPSVVREPGSYARVYRCSMCGWSTTRYAEIDGHENQLEPGHLVTSQVEREA